MKNKKKIMVNLLCSMLFMCVCGLNVAEASDAADVSLRRDDGKIALMNGIIKMEFNENGSLDSLVKGDVELIKNRLAKGASFYVDYNAEGAFRNLKVTDCKIIKNTSEEAHIAFIDSTGLLYLEYHVILKKGESGFYSYVVAKNHTGTEIRLSELRTVYRLDTNIFTHSYNAERIGKQPTKNYLRQFRIIQDETYELPTAEYDNGNVYSKYDYAGYYSENDFWGQMGNGFGLWFIPVSKEYYPGGPLKQDLLVHYDAIILNYMTGAHFGTGDFMVATDWQKIYGPWYTYINQGAEKEVIQDAAKKADLETAKWPYSWMNEPLYPVKRATVTGSIKMTHDRSAGNCMVILAQPGSDPQEQKDDYIFYVKADETGHFTLPNVRPGSYTLYAYATQGDVTDTFTKDAIDVPDKNIDLGEMVWDAPYHKHKLWQIGIADRKATEFKYGNKPRNYMWHTMVPYTLDYYIETDKDRDWYYAQSKDGDYNIHFTLNRINAPCYFLTVAMAGASGGNIMTISVNGKSIKTVSYKNDGSVYRSAMQSGAYHVEQLEIQPDMLKIGENRITFTTSGMSILYDTILLECDD